MKSQNDNARAGLQRSLERIEFVSAANPAGRSSLNAGFSPNEGKAGAVYILRWWAERWTGAIPIDRRSARTKKVI